MERLVIEIDGNASGLTRELGRAQKNLTGFNNYVQAGNRALTGFTKSLSVSAGAVGRLATSTVALRTNLNALNRTATQTATGLARLNSEARTASGSLRTFGNALSTIVGRLNAVSTASKGATTSINSLNRRAAALGTTVTAVNAALRGFLRGLSSVRTGAGGGMTVINNYSGAIAGAGVAAGRTGGLFQRLHKHTLGLGESFRRTVAQITALRTLTYQGLFWFAPLIYSVIKVNAQYERQMVLLKNLSKQSTETAKAQEALQWRGAIVDFSRNAPFSMEQLTDTFVKLKVAGVDPLNGSMHALVDSVAAFGGTDDALGRASVALQQMAGKGVVSMEELRQQLGEHVPDAMRAMATGLGMTMAELFDATKQGQVEAVDGITKMLAVLRNAHMGAAQAMMNTWSGLMARLSTTWQNFVVRLTQSAGENSFIGTLKKQILELQTFLNTPAGTNFASSIQQALVSLIGTITSIVKWLYANREAVIAVAKAFVYYWGANTILSIVIRIMTAMSKLWSILNIGAKTVAATYAVLTGRTTAAAAAQMAFGSNVRRAATSLGILNAAGAVSIRTLAMIAVRFLGIVTVAIAAAAAIWAVVRALNAQNREQAKNNSLKQSAETGGVFESDKERDKERNRLLGYKQRSDEGGYWQNGPKGERYFVKDSPEVSAKYKKWYDEGGASYNLKLANTRRVNESQVDFTFREANTKDIYSGLRNDFEKRKLGVTDPEKIRQIEAEQSVAMGKAARDDAQRLQALADKSKNPAEKKAIEGLIADRIKETNEFAGGAQALITPNVQAQGDDKDKKKKEKKGSDYDPLDRYRNQYASAFTRAEELKQEYENLRDGTGKEFDMEGADEIARNTAAKIKNKEELQKLIIAEKERAKFMQQMVAIEKDAIDLENETTDSYHKSQDALEDLKLGYNSVGQEINHYRDHLNRAHKSQLDFLETQLAQEPVTEEQIEQYKEFERQYQRLTKAIDDAVAAKKAELLVDAAREAKAANEDYYAKFRTPRAQASYENNRAQQEVMDAINMARDLADGAQLADRVAKIRDELATATANYNAASRTGDKARADELQNEIVVIGHRIEEESRASQIARDSLPILQERLRILREEQAIRDKMHGFGGPLYDWAIDAKKGMDDLGESMGKIVTDGLDGLIEGLANGKLAFGDFVKSILKGLLMIIIRAIIAKAILAALGMAGGGGGGGGLSTSGGVTYDSNGVGANTSGIYHSGGIVGAAAPSRRSIDSSMFNFAQRYHSGGVVGLRPNEVPIIAEKGEGVFTKEEMKSMGKGGSANVQVNVINQTGVQTEVERDKPRFDGEKWVEQIILKKATRPGPVRDALRNAGR